MKTIAKAAIAVGALAAAGAAYLVTTGGSPETTAAPSQTAEAQAAAPGPAADAAAQPEGGPVYREFIYGDPNAKVTIIEYASLTCGHCAAFAQEVLPELKKNYIDTGKARLVFRDYPLDGLAMAGAVLARCAPGDRGKVMIDLLMKNQEAWVRAAEPLTPLKGYAQLAGMSSEDVDACLQNQEMIKAVRDVQTTADNLYQVEATPTFFIGEEKISGNRGYAFMAEIIERQLKE